MNLQTQLAQLETAQLVHHLAEEEPAYVFRHTLTQESAYDSLLKNQRREIHRTVAHAYEKIYADRCMDEFAAVLARHYAEAGDDEQALVYSTHAGDVAARIYANTEAIAFYTQALDIAKQRADNTAQLIYLYTRLEQIPLRLTVCHSERSEESH
jgi:predicted ATPase